MWEYAQGSGELYFDSELVATGYSGLGEGKNNPALEGVKDVGPIPRGFYTIGAPENVDTPGKHGKFVLRLTPVEGTNTHGRDGFLIHGDAFDHPGAASEGCIVVARPARDRIAASGETLLHVVA